MGIFQQFSDGDYSGGFKGISDLAFQIKDPEQFAKQQADDMALEQAKRAQKSQQDVRGLFSDPINAGLPIDQLVRKAAAIDPAYAKQLIEMEMAKVGVGGNTPAALQEYAAYQRMTPEQQAEFMRIKRGQQIVNMGGSIGTLNPTGGGLFQQFPVTPKPEQMPEFQGAQAQAQAQGKATGEAVGAQGVSKINAPKMDELISMAEKLLPQASSGMTGGIGAAIKGLVGYSDETTQADKQLEVISAALTGNVPRFEGPQGVLDVELYKQAAGDVANRSKPRGDRLAALKTMKQLNAKYLPQSAHPPAPASNAAPSSGGKRVRFEDLK